MLLRSPGSWLYRRANLTWLSDASLVRQLPLTYRLFANYCQTRGFHPAIAELLLQGITATRQRNGIVPLRIDDLTVMLDLHDPRFLRVPGEVTEVPHIVSRFLKPGDTFIDVGANHGCFSIVASHLVGPQGLVISIEPQPRLAALLGTLLANGPARFRVHPIACGDRSGDVELYIPRTTSGSAGLFKAFSGRSRHRTVAVALRRLDDLIDWRGLPGRTFMKVDIEGSELAFLSGACDLIRATAPPILLEMNPRAMRAAGTSAAGLIEALAGLGYEQMISPDGSTPPRPLCVEKVPRDVIVLPAKRSVDYLGMRS